MEHKVYNLKGAELVGSTITDLYNTVKTELESVTPYPCYIFTNFVIDGTKQPDTLVCFNTDKDGNYVAYLAYANMQITINEDSVITKQDSATTMYNHNISLSYNNQKLAFTIISSNASKFTYADVCKWLYTNGYTYTPGQRITDTIMNELRRYPCGSNFILGPGNITLINSIVLQAYMDPFGNITNESVIILAGIWVNFNTQSGGWNSDTVYDSDFIDDDVSLA